MQNLTHKQTKRIQMFTINHKRWDFREGCTEWLDMDEMDCARICLSKYTLDVRGCVSPWTPWTRIVPGNEYIYILDVRGCVSPWTPWTRIVPGNEYIYILDVRGCVSPWTPWTRIVPGNVYPVRKLWTAGKYSKWRWIQILTSLFGELVTRAKQFWFTNIL